MAFRAATYRRGRSRQVPPTVTPDGSDSSRVAGRQDFPRHSDESDRSPPVRYAAWPSDRDVQALASDSRVQTLWWLTGLGWSSMYGVHPAICRTVWLAEHPRSSASPHCHIWTLLQQLWSLSFSQLATRFSVSSRLSVRERRPQSSDWTMYSIPSVKFTLSETIYVGLCS